MTHASVDSVIKSFSHSTFPKIEGELDFLSVKNIEKLVITNASSCKSELGEGHHGMLGLIILPIQCQTITGHQFARHNNPGASLTFLNNPA